MRLVETPQATTSTNHTGGNFVARGLNIQNSCDGQTRPEQKLRSTRQIKQWSWGGRGYVSDRHTRLPKVFLHTFQDILRHFSPIG